MNGLPGRVRPDTALLGLSFVIAAGFLGSMLHFTGGILLLPLDDSYIYLRYAERLATGHPFQYGPGEPPSTGATSPLYVLALLPGALAGLHGDGLVLWAFLLNALLLGASLLIALRVLRRLFDEELALASAFLIGTTGVFAWGFLSGMEIGLTLVLFLGAAEALARELPEGRARWSPVLLSLLALTRPEAAIFALGIGITLALAPATRLSRRGRAAMLLPVAAVAAVILTDLLLTGRPGPDSGRPKSPLMTPSFAPVFVLQHAVGYVVNVVKALLTGVASASGLGTLNLPDPLAFFPPFALLLWLAGALPALAKETGQRRPGLHWFLFSYLGTGILAVALSSGSGVHHQRYLLPFLVPFAIYLVPGAVGLARRLAGSDEMGRPAARLVLALLFAWQGTTLTMWSIAYGRECRGFLEYREAALFVRDRLPRDASVAVLDAGIVGLYSGHRLVDLFGLTTSSLAPVNAYFADSMGSRWEALVTLPRERRPDFFLAHRSRYDEHGDEGHLDPFRTRPVRAFGTPPPGFPSVGRDLTLWQIDWELLRPEPLPRDPALRERLAGRRLLDSLNVADVADERAHRYEYTPSTADTFQANRVVTAAIGGGSFTDGVRGVAGTERFALRAPGPVAAVLVLRTNHLSEPLAVLVNGASFPVEARTERGFWAEIAISIPSGVLHPGKNDVAVSGSYGSARLWLFGPQS